MRFNHKTSLYFSGAFFLVLFFVGFLLSLHKLLWLDEYFSQCQSIDKQSYMNILTAHFPDGNRCPLFYIMQKIISDIFCYHLPVLKNAGSFYLSDTRSQVVMRILPNFYMSLALAAIFYYFTMFFSLLTAIYAMAVALVSPLIWFNWVEARPYSLWFLLTTAQLLFFCTSVHAPKIKVNASIFWVHFLLVLTTPGSILQVTVIAMMLFIKGGYKKRLLFLTWVIPMGVFLSYFFLVPMFKIKTFYFFTILFDAVMPERLFVYVVYALVVLWISKNRKESLSNAFFLPVFLLFLLSGCLMLLLHLFTHNFQFGFFNRYLIYLVPVDIVMFTLASYDLWHWARSNVWVCMNVSIVLGGLVIMRGLLTYRSILAAALYLHSPG